MFPPCPTQLWTRGHEIVQGHWGWDFKAEGGGETPGHLSRGQIRKAAGDFLQWSPTGCRLCSVSCLVVKSTPWTVTHQAPPSVGFPRQEYWSGFAISFSGGCSPPRDQTCISCIGRWILYPRSSASEERQMNQSSALQADSLVGGGGGGLTVDKLRR